MRYYGGGLAVITICLGLVWPAGAAPDAGGLVYCFDPSRNLVHRVRSEECRGRVVSAEVAERLERQIRQERLNRARKAANPRQPQKGQGRRSGSGVLLTNQGHVATARHVIEGCGAVTVHDPSGDQYVARVLALHAKADLALLRSEVHGRPKIVMAQASNLKQGAPLAAVGYPNVGRTAIRPLRSAAKFVAERVIADKQLEAYKRIIFQGELRAGNSGGALVDSRERLVGIVVAQLDTPAVFKATGRLIQHVGIAEPIAAVQELFETAGIPIPPRGGEPASNRAEGAVYRITCANER